MPTNAEISAWLAQRQVPQTAQNANIAARIMGADAIASRGGRETGALDASEEVNRLYDQLNMRSGGSSSGSPRRDIQPTVTMNPPSAAATPPRSAATPLDPDTNLEGDPATLAAIIGIGGAAAAARRLFGGRGAAGPNAPTVGGGPTPTPGGGPRTPAPAPNSGLVYRGSSGGSPTISGALPAPGGPPPVGPIPEAVLTAPAPQTALPAPPRALPAPPAAPVTVPAEAVPPAGPPRMTPANVPQQSSLGPQQSIMRVNPALPNATTAVNPGPSPVQEVITARRMSPEAARAARAGTPPGVLPGSGGLRVPSGAVGGGPLDLARRAAGAQMLERVFGGGGVRLSPAQIRDQRINMPR